MNSLNKHSGNNLNGNKTNGNKPDSKIEIETITGIKSNALDAKVLDITGEIAQITNKIGNKIHQITTITTETIDPTMEDKMVSETLDQITKDREITTTIIIETT